VLDPRVRVEIGDVARVIEAARRASLDAIVLDIYEGPHASGKHPDDPFYGRAALDRTHAALSPGGVLTVWAEALDVVFKRRMLDAGFDTTVHHPGASRSYVVYVGRKRSRA
jgi:spermidine synthase